jgi:hypothetical protein
MSRLLGVTDWRERWQLGDEVWFDAPYGGGRLKGEIVRTSSNPAYFHVEAGGERYEVDMHRDRMSYQEEP